MRRVAVAGAAAAVAAGLAAGLVLTIGSSSSSGQWVLHDLGTLPGLTECAPTAMNEQGQIVGTCEPFGRGGVHGFLWQGGKWIDLGRDIPFPEAINDRGQIVGGDLNQAFLWQHGTISRLSTPAGALSQAIAINERGQIAGVMGGRAVLWQGGRAVYLGMSQPSAINDHGEIVGVGPGTRGRPADAFVWRSGKAIDLGPFSLNSEGIGIDDAGEVVASGSQGAFLWRNGTFTRFEHGLIYGSINDRGQILLQTEFGSDKRSDAYLWEHGRLTLLPHFGRHLATFANDMNDRGQVIGWSLLSIGWPLPFVWQKGQKLTALPTTKAGAGPPHTEAFGINDRGQIAGYGYGLVHGHTEQHLLLWTRRA